MRSSRTRSTALCAALLLTLPLAACSSGNAATDDSRAKNGPTHLYWANNGIHQKDPLRASAHTVGRANLDGSQADQAFIPNISYPTGLAVYGDYIYWTDIETNSIGRAAHRRI